MAASNVRPWAIFTGYMVLAATLTTKAIAIIRAQRRARSTGRPADGGGPAPSGRRAVVLLSLLAALSLATTWYHMFRFFEWSYGQWAIAHVAGADADGLRLGKWLRDTSLFRQAWASTLETAPRAWWSLQIFGFCANWSIMLAVQCEPPTLCFHYSFIPKEYGGQREILPARKRNIPHAWVFILLGQVVAISFAANLSFLAVLCSELPDRKRAAAPSAFSWHTVLLFGNLLWAMSIPSAVGKPGFMLLLLGPHLLAFAPLLLDKIFPARTLGEPAWFWKAASMAWVLAVAFKGAFDENVAFEFVIRTLYEHPAVSSVGWDVICCWVSFGAWAVVGLN
ncbi:hypothetical protein CMUS01_13977 [Colletotrichum musicola]|uniref:Alpha-mannosyltransferase alg11p n=1 Tax=Colletotrichum musicola TaxID=2175873 RepID=A0A8H6MT11_9PEZI|nr:hypothetical protein CMUS01_13977 [Colletotrichum musicola]